VLSRNHAEFVKKIFELEVPEIYDKTIEISKIVREPGYRTKIAVRSTREDVDPVGACVGLKGVRIQAVVRELEGEKIDILRYSLDSRSFIKNALSPAEVNQVVILDEAKKLALAIVPDAQFSLAIGKQGLNVRLANRLTDWNIDVKTETQFSEMDISAEAKRAVSALFGETEEEIQKISELPGISQRLVEILEKDNIADIESLVALSPEQLAALEGITAEDIQTIHKIIEENVEIVEEEQAPAAEEENLEAEEAAAEETEVAEEPVAEAGESAEQAEVAQAAAGSAVSEAPAEEEDTYECPECGTPITPDMATCPNCGVGLTFEDDADETPSAPEGKASNESLGPAGAAGSAEGKR